MAACVRDLADIAVKLISAIGGFLGGSSILVYMPAKDWNDAVKRIGVSIVAAVMLTVPVADKIFDTVDNEVLMGVAFVIGFAAWFTLGAFARFFENRQGKDILQITKDVKNGTSTDD